MKQQCHLSMIWLSWGVYLAGVGFLAVERQWMLIAAWLVAVPLAEWVYLRSFPKLSSAMGYGEIRDEPPAIVARVPAQVRLYTALGCPFCPILERRLRDLQATMGFTLEKTDVTLRPDLLASRGVRSVPAVEVDGHLLVGLTSTRDLAEAIERAEVRAGR
ncbi:MAG TPA: thioredoxin family protein [Acidobacteriaceae bacterium]|nr:thioredoxin family protein [Acidobacteriaceae bacterium]